MKAASAITKAAMVPSRIARRLIHGPLRGAGGVVPGSGDPHCSQ